jgi:hypothetical protein
MNKLMRLAIHIPRASANPAQGNPGGIARSPRHAVPHVKLIYNGAQGRSVPFENRYENLIERINKTVNHIIGH